MNNSPVLKEIVVTADEESLNRAIAEKHITGSASFTRPVRVLKRRQWPAR